MTDFIEVTEHVGGKRILVNVEHIMKIRPDETGSRIYFVAVSGNHNGVTSNESVHVTESYSTLKRKLGI